MLEDYRATYLAHEFMGISSDEAPIGQASFDLHHDLVPRAALNDGDGPSPRGRYTITITFEPEVEP